MQDELNQEDADQEEYDRESERVIGAVEREDFSPSSNNKLHPKHNKQPDSHK